MRPEWTFWVCIMASMSGTLYIGITNFIEKRVKDHKEGFIEGFSKKIRMHSFVVLRELLREL